MSRRICPSQPSIFWLVDSITKYSSGAFDKYPRLRPVIGHMGESMPLYRFDWMQSNAERVFRL